MSAWTASTAYLATAVVTPTTFAGYTWRATVAGTSGLVEPVWPAGGSGVNSITDGGVTWERGTGFRMALAAGILSIVSTFAAANPTIVASVGTIRPGSFGAVSLPHFYLAGFSETIDTASGVRTRTFEGCSGFLVDEYGTMYDSNERMDLAADALADLFTANFHAASGVSMFKHSGTFDGEQSDGPGLLFPSLEFRFDLSKISEGRV